MATEIDNYSNVILNFFATSVSKTNIFKHMKKIRELESNIKDLEQRQRLTEADSKKLEKLNLQLDTISRETNQVERDAITKELPEWLDDTARKGFALGTGKSSNKATHLLKFTHSSSNHFSICVTDRKQVVSNYLTTTSLSDDYFDVAHSNGNMISISKFLLIPLQNKNLLIDFILRGDFSFLDVFKVSASRRSDWERGLSCFVSDKAELALDKHKQIYFPISQDEYHLMTPLFSSALSEALNRKINVTRYDKGRVKTRALRKEGCFSASLDVNIPDIAIQHFGGEHPQNVSVLNFGRSGNSYLVKASPPKWHHQFNLPKSSFSFWLAYSRRTSKVLREMVKFFKRVDDYNNITIREQRKAFIEQAIDIFLLQSTQIREAKDKAGWSEHTDMAQFEQFWLDPYRQDEAFQQAKQSSDWVGDLADRYARRLNEQLRYYGLNVAAAEHQTWIKQVKQSMVDDIRIFNL